MQFNVTGMSCAACQARIEKAVGSVDGVTECAVSLLTNSMNVEGTASAKDIIKAVKDAGYGASVKRGDRSVAESEDELELEDIETPKMVKRLIASLVFWIVLMYFTMGHMMFGLPVPGIMDGDHVMMGLVQLLLTVIIMVINQRFFISGFKSLWHRAPNMDSLVALGASAAFVYSLAALFAMVHAQYIGDSETVMKMMDELYFESAATILTLITVGKTLEARSKGKTTDALRSLIKLRPKTACVIKDGAEVQVPVSDVRLGDVFAVRPGEQIPVDGKVIEGISAVDESALTGESIPVDKEAGSSVYTGTMNRSGYIKCEAVKVGEDTALSQIIKMVSDASASKAPIAKIADKVSGVFVPTVIVIALVTSAVWLIIGKGAGFALARGISVLVISCPCALGLATPVAIMVGSGVGAKNGILFKTAVSLEETGKTEIAVLDKTGTVTLGKPEVTDIVPAYGLDNNALLEVAFGLEKKSEHPLAKAVTDYCEKMGISAVDTDGFEALPGNGLRGTVGGKEAVGGSVKFVGENVEVPDEIAKKAGEFAEKGRTPLLFALGGKCLGMISVADVIKEDSPEAVSELKNMGIRVVMLTGDNEKTAAAICAETGIDEFVAGVLPQGKEAEIRRLKLMGRTAMVGDGINDAPALTSADVGLAIGAGTDVAIDAADVVLMHGSLKDAAAAVRLSRATLRIIHQNLFWAFCYNVIGIPLAAGLFIPFGITLNPMFGAAAMGLSSFCVVSNALRLNLFDVHNPSHDKKSAKSHNISKNFKEEKIMTKTVKIEGMMCPHCEMTVKTALEALDGVISAEVSHEVGKAVVTLSKEVSDAKISSAVEAKGYKVVGVE